MARGARCRDVDFELLDQLAWAACRVEGVDAGGEESQVGSKLGLGVPVEGGEQVRLGGLQPAVQSLEQPGASLGGDDVPGSSIGGVGVAFDQPGSLEVVEEVGHDRAVDAQALR